MIYNKYEQSLLEAASTLDFLVQSNVICFKQIVLDMFSTGDDSLVAKLCLNLSAIAEKSNVSIVKAASLLKDKLVDYIGHRELCRICSSDNKEENEQSLEELLENLEQLIGLNTVKEKVRDLIAYQKVQKMRREQGLHVPKHTLHLAFMGNPGTGKTTVARIIGHIYKKLGLLSKGHFVEVSRTDLIAGYQGQTALKVKKVINKALGGVLFIDEAYSITENENSDSYGRECLTELTKALEDYREDLVVIVAGYTEPMKQFFDSNPGLKSRFNTFVMFDDYTGDELFRIFEKMCKEDDYEMSTEVVSSLKGIFSEKANVGIRNFANGRYVRNVYEDMVMNHARRVIKEKNPSLKQLEVFEMEDISEFLECREYDNLKTKY